MKLAPTVSILLTTALSCTTRLTMHTMVASHQRRKVNSPDGHWTHSLTVRCWWVAVWWCSLFDSSLILPVPQLFACYQSTAIKSVLLFGDICCEFCISFKKKCSHVSDKWLFWLSLSTPVKVCECLAALLEEVIFWRVAVFDYHIVAQYLRTDWLYFWQHSECDSFCCNQLVQW